MPVSKFCKDDEVVYTGDALCLKKGQVYTVKQHDDGEHYVECSCGPHSLDEGDECNKFDPFIQKHAGWIGVDLDGTLAIYTKWQGPYHIGEPIPVMVARIKAWLAQGRDVRIFTARVTEKDKNEDGTPHDLAAVRDAIEQWCLREIGRALPITNVKDWLMMELWDDRCVQVVPNTGRTLAEEHEAIRNAEAGKAATA